MTRKLPTFDPTFSSHATTLADLGMLVRNQRAQLGLRIDDAAGFSGVGSSVLSRLENGKPVTSDKLFSVLGSLGLHMVVLPKGQFIEAEKNSPNTP